MKKLVYMLCTFCLFFVAACDNEEVETPSNTRSTYYFDGYVNGEKVIRTSSNRAPLSIGCVRNGEWTYYRFGYQWSKYKLFISMPLQKGDIALYAIDELDETKGFVSVYDKLTGAVYSPLDTPFMLRVKALSFHPEDSELPYVEGEMEGVLHNEADPQDVIEIRNAFFGSH